MKSSLRAAALFLFLFTSIASASEFSRTEVKTFNISRGGKVSVENVNGTIRVESWNSDQVSLQITKTVRAGDSEDAEEYFGKVWVEIETGSNYVKVRTHYSHEDGWGILDWIFHGGSGRANIDYVLKVPSSVKVDAGTTNGNVDVHDVSGYVKVSSTNGHLSLEGVGGFVEGSTTNGGITASLSSSNKFEELRLHTTNGSIKVYFPEEINADIHAHTTNGSIRSEFPITVEGGFLSKSIDGKINDGGNEIDLSTTNGSIELNKK